MPSVHCKRSLSRIESCALVSFLSDSDIGRTVVEELHAGRLRHEIMRRGQTTATPHVVPEAEQLSLRWDKSGVHIPCYVETQAQQAIYLDTGMRVQLW